MMLPESHLAQKGAVSLIAVLFLTAVVTTVLLLTMRQSGTEVLSSRQGNDELQALFVAESALDRAAARLKTLDTSSDCSGLAETSNSFIGGSFELLNPAWNGNECRFQITARVNQAKRSIEAVLAKGAGADAWAVGKNGVIQQRVTGVWSVVASNTTEVLHAVHCVSVDDCWAVGKSGVTLRWNGGSWTLTTLNAGEDYHGLACAPGDSSHCFLVGTGGYDGFTRYWNGTAWSPALETVASGYVLWAVECPSNRCYAVGQAGYVQVYNGAWSQESSEAGETLEGLSCYDENNCWAATASEGQNFVVLGRASVNNPLWQKTLVAENAKRNLNDVACASASECWAVGDNGSALRWSDSGGGPVWSYYGKVDNHRFNGIDCRGSDQQCLAVGGNGSVHLWDGSSWGAETTATNKELLDVFFMDAESATTVAVVAWKELIN